MEVKDVFDFMNMEDAQREKLLASLTQAQLRVRYCLYSTHDLINKEDTLV